MAGFAPGPVDGPSVAVPVPVAVAVDAPVTTAGSGVVPGSAPGPVDDPSVAVAVVVVVVVPPPVSTVGAERVAPPAGFAVRISGTTQATAPAEAIADMRPMAWRRERRVLSQ